MCHSCDTKFVAHLPRRFSSRLSSPFFQQQVDRLAALSLRKPVRIEVDPLFDLAQRLVQDFVRVRRSREPDREAMLLARYLSRNLRMLAFACLLCSAALACCSCLALVTKTIFILLLKYNNKK